jgi:hypothetical protein
MGSARLVAERDPRPTLTVVSFSGVPSDTGDAMADVLASQLVETGRYRVLTRNWLPVRPGASQPSLAALRDAAAEAGVEYLVLGQGRQARSLGQARPDVLFLDVSVVSVATGEVIRTATGQSQMTRHTRPPRSVVPITPPRTRLPMPFAPMTPPQSRLPTSVVPMTQPGGSGTPLIRLAAAAVSARRGSRAASVPQSWEAVLAGIAKSITLSGESR